MRCSKIFVVTSLILVYLPCTNTTPDKKISLRPGSCHDLLENDETLKGKDGVYTIDVDDEDTDVYCDMTTDGGGWTVIQRRIDGSWPFYLNWQHYKQGFGHAYSNHWMGNDPIHALTKTRQMLRVQLLSFDGQVSYATYSTFRVGSEKNKYKLTISGFKGPAGDSLGDLNGMSFSTLDNDNDKGSGNCAEQHHGGWWYKDCALSNLNGQYFGSPLSNSKSMFWFGWMGFKSLKGTVMMVRPTAKKPDSWSP